jgi:hypothetical protein
LFLDALASIDDLVLSSDRILIKGDAGYVASALGLPRLTDPAWGSFSLDNFLPVSSAT